MIDLENEVAIVTGAGHGIGEAVAKLLAENGAKVAVTDVVDGREAVAESIESAGGSAIAREMDVTDPEPLPADHPLWSFENVQITPHNAGNTPKYYDRLADILATNIRRIEETGETEGLENQVG